MFFIDLSLIFTTSLPFYLLCQFLKSDVIEVTVMDYFREKRSVRCICAGLNIVYNLLNNIVYNIYLNLINNSCVLLYVGYRSWIFRLYKSLLQPINTYMTVRTPRLSTPPYTPHGSQPSLYTPSTCGLNRWQPSNELLLVRIR